MSETDTKSTTSLLQEELESWRPFLDALRDDDRQIARNLIEKCWKFVNAIESSGKKYLVEPLFLTILLIQEERIKWLESQIKMLREEIDAWKSKAGS